MEEKEKKTSAKKERREVVHVFMSHTKLDEKFCDRFDRAAARVGARVFRSEFETIEAPAWKTIKKEMELSSAMFLLVGKELVKSQAASDMSPEAREEWKHTQNWIAYEIGLACELGIDVWVWCDKVDINFPVPYLNNYATLGKFNFIRGVLDGYSKGHSYFVGRQLYGKDDIVVNCPYKECGAIFNFHSKIKENEEITCPTCLKRLVFKEGWLL